VANKKPVSDDWDKSALDEWAFSVVALGWARDEYWKASRFEFIECFNMYMKINGHEEPKADPKGLIDFLKHEYNGESTHG
jgi:hypothetical protein